MRLINTNNLGVGKCNPKVFNDKSFAAGWNSAIQAITEASPTIDPETLPIVQELRAQLAQVTAERDAAIEWLADLEVCGCCKNTQCRSRDGEEDCKFEWIGIQEVQDDE